MVYTHALGACAARRGGSIPLPPTKSFEKKVVKFYYFLFTVFNHHNPVFAEFKLEAEGVGW